MARIDLRRVASCRREFERARLALHDSILSAVDSGESYADVARMAGYSKSRIGQIVLQRRNGVR